MSDRYMIAVYIDRHIVDIGYYRNWDDKSLFYEAIARAALYKDCKTAEEYRMRKYGYEEPDDSEEFLKEFEACSETLIVVDISEQCIYGNRGGALDRQQLSMLPIVYDIGNDHKFSMVSVFQNYYVLQGKWKLPFGHVSSSEIIALIKDWGDSYCYLSKRTMEQIMKCT